MKPKISVIVPVYKVEQYLDRCVQSILNQTYTDFELILVDDGSPDKCPAICDAYAGKYENIRVLHKKNGGLSDARNAGTAIAQGKYVTYVDSDDYIHPLYLEILIEALQFKGADIAVLDIAYVYDSNMEQNIDKKNILVECDDSIKALTRNLYQTYHDVCAVGLLLPIELAKKNPFPVGKLFEDLYTTYKYYLQKHKVAVIKKKLYYYYQRSDSIMGRRNDQFIFDLMEASEILLQKCSFDSNLKKAAENKCFSNYCRIVSLVPDLQCRFPDYYDFIKSFLMQNRWFVLFNTHSRLKNKIAALALLGGIQCLRKLYSLKNK